MKNLDIALKLGLIESEYNKIVDILGREPNFTELSIFSVMWSEHCSYKNSILHLKRLPKEGSNVLAKAGEENAGLVDIGGGLACAFKIESHNHPSAIEPFQGAATGVGGIHRDIFTMGARPIATLNSLRFGNPNSNKTKGLFREVIRGISHYGNCLGIPTVGGEIYFDDSYETNPLVNVMSVGIVKIGETVSATSKGVGNGVWIVGAMTGKDGIHGASFASGDLDENSHENIPSIQVGDPFMEKLLLEATLESVNTDSIVGMQDMGAAGIICSTSEMSAKGGYGMKIHLDRVPTRQVGMEPYEIILSESQERMLMVLDRGKESKVLEIFKKWDLNCVEIGEVTEGGMLEYYMKNELIAKVPAKDLVLGGGAPQYIREFNSPQPNKEFNIDSVPEPENLVDVMKHLCGDPNLCSRSYVSDQYDSMVGNRTLQIKNDAAVVRVDRQRGLAMTVDCNSHYVEAHPKIGTMMAVAEAARNIVCSGGKPLGITNNLNFGNPYNHDVYGYFVGAIDGMREACVEFEVPVTGGNVSFYNQSSDGGAVLPTPTIGMIGLVDDMSKCPGLKFKSEGDMIIVLGEMLNDISSSQYLINRIGVKKSQPPHFNIRLEKRLQGIVLDLIDYKAISSAHDISEGGLFMNLFESCVDTEFSFDIKNIDREIRNDAFLFGESGGRVVITFPKKNLGLVKDLVGDFPHQMIGFVSKGPIKFNGEVQCEVDALKIEWNARFNKLFELTQ